MKKICALILSLVLPPAVTLGLTPNLTTNIDRPLRYHPDGRDFVIENGVEFFNRPLYGTNTAFRVDAGDRPEFSLYLPGRGGSLRIGMKTAAGAKWLFDAEKIVARYRPGSMLYEIHDPLLGAGTLRLTALAMDRTEGLVIRAELEGESSIDLVWAYGGANGQRGRRDGDIGCEKVPVGEFFQLKPEFCKDNEFTIHASSFTLHSKPADIMGLATQHSKLVVADAAKWSSLNDLLAASGKKAELPVVVGETLLNAGKPFFLALQRIAKGETRGDELQIYKEVRSEKAGAPKNVELAPPYKIEQLPQLFEDAEKRRREIAERVVVDTPDAFINAAASAFCVAADGVWDEAQGVFMHGAVAWRTRLLGWRGAYSGDALGWHDRTRRHLMNWFPKQNTDPITVEGEPAKVPQDASVNFARNEPALHSNGDLSHSHYDMNLLAIDILFRHLLWTGDLDFARKVWPVIERHLAWERRLFRREFGPEKLPLYEAYCCIWASDDLQYEGGGAAHSSALNYYHNKMAARVAKLLGLDPKPYEHEAGLIAKAMRKYLWVQDGWFAESKDLLGLQLTHNNPALWTFYHTVDSEVPTPMEAWQMSRYVDTQVAHIPLRGAGVPEGYCTLPTTSWMPYTWSTNNVVMAEVAHTSLAYWQAGRGEEAFRLFKGCLLDSMFMGLCPGNVGMCTQFDVSRRESQRDFADGVGAVSRALIEGLCGIKPDALAGEIVICPGYPVEWEHAALKHPDLQFAFQRKGLVETYTIKQSFARPMKLRLQARALCDEIESITVNGHKAEWRTIPTSAGWQRVEIECPSKADCDVAITWKGNKQQRKIESAQPISISAGNLGQVQNWNQPVPASTKWECVGLEGVFNDKVTQIFKNDYLSPRSPYCSLAFPKQGIGSWIHWNPATDKLANANIDDSGLRALSDANQGRIVLPNGIPFQTPGTGEAKNIAFTSRWNNYPHEIAVPLSGKAEHAYLVMAGSTNSMQSQFDNGEVTVTYTDGSTQRLALRNPTNWWPIDQDYFIDDYAFHRPEPIPPRVDLKTGAVRIVDLKDFKGKGGKIDGGAATVLDMPLDSKKELKSLTVRTLANEVVIGLMSLTLVRP